MVQSEPESEEEEEEEDTGGDTDEVSTMCSKASSPLLLSR